MKNKELRITRDEAEGNTYYMEAEFSTDTPAGLFHDSTGMIVEISASVIRLCATFEYSKKEGETKKWAREQCLKAIKQAYENIKEEGLDINN